MNDLEFFKSFHFREFITKAHTTDNSGGVDLHFLGYLKVGKCLLISESERIEINVGDMFYIPKGCRYRSYWTGDSVRFDSIGFTYMPNPTGKRYRLQKLHYTDEQFRVFLPLSNDKTVNTASVGALYTLLGMLQPKMELDPINRQSILTEKAMQFMEEKPQCSISEAASACNVSESTLYTTFKKVLGKSPNRVRQEIVCKKAVDLLITTVLPVEEISSALGFSSSSYFRKVLYSIYKTTPGRIRKQKLSL